MIKFMKLKNILFLFHVKEDTLIEIGIIHQFE